MCKSPHGHGRVLDKEEKEIGRAVANKESTAFHWLLAEKDEESSFFLLGSAIIPGVRASPSRPPLYSTEVSVYFFTG